MKWGRGLIVYLTIVAILYGTQDLAAISALAQVLAQYSKTPLRHRGVAVEYLERRRGIVEEGYSRYGPQTPEGLFGGEAGARAETFVERGNERIALRSKQAFRLRRGDRLVMRTAPYPRSRTSAVSCRPDVRRSRARKSRGSSGSRVRSGKPRRSDLETPPAKSPVGRALPAKAHRFAPSGGTHARSRCRAAWSQPARPASVPRVRGGGS